MLHFCVEVCLQMRHTWSWHKCLVTMLSSAKRCSTRFTSRGCWDPTSMGAPMCIDWIRISWSMWQYCPSVTLETRYCMVARGSSFQPGSLQLYMERQSIRGESTRSTWSSLPTSNKGWTCRCARARWIVMTRWCWGKSSYYKFASPCGTILRCDGRVTGRGGGKTRGSRLKRVFVANMSDERMYNKLQWNQQLQSR